MATDIARREWTVLPIGYPSPRFIGGVHTWRRMAVLPRIEATCGHKHIKYDAARRCAIRLLHR